ncbi:uncharacterized protein LOC106011749 [Aplysia californica]|uniref:Uncharacterized protein LOC106011749 n=1 Tax=Aplysia californica TaxID=6500 RepID=A0ABM0ZZT5_APLCA|nr:uncharacterized protein LOC106011749 [Aplysia californica]
MKFPIFVAAALATLVAIEAAKMVRVKREALASRDKRAAVSFASLAGDAHLGVFSSFRAANDDIVETPKGVSRRRLKQTFGDLEVIGASAEAESDQTGHLTGHMYGSVATGLVKDIPDPEACQRSIDEMLEIAITGEHYDVNDPNIDNKDGRRVVWVDSETHVGSLAYRVEFLYVSSDIISRPAYYINACTKDVIVSFDQRAVPASLELAGTPRQAALYTTPTDYV